MFNIFYKQEMVSTPLNEWEKAVNGHSNDSALVRFSVKVTMREWFAFALWIMAMIKRALDFLFGGEL
jgi:hypothetical protein